MLLFITVLVDVRTNKIPNIILILLVTVRINSVLFFHSTIDGTYALEKIGSRCLTVFFIFIFLYVFFSIGGLGAGDLKLLIILAAGMESPLEFVAAVFAMAAVFSLIRMMKSRNFSERLNVLQQYLRQVRKAGKPIPYYTVKPHIGDRMKHSIHLSIPVFIAYSIFCILGKVAV